MSFTKAINKGQQPEYAISVPKTTYSGLTFNAALSIHCDPAAPATARMEFSKLPLLLNMLL